MGGTVLGLVVEVLSPDEQMPIGKPPIECCSYPNWKSLHLIRSYHLQDGQNRAQAACQLDRIFARGHRLEGGQGRLRLRTEDGFQGGGHPTPTVEFRHNLGRASSNYPASDHAQAERLEEGRWRSRWQDRPVRPSVSERIQPKLVDRVSQACDAAGRSFGWFLQSPRRFCHRQSVMP